MAKGTVSENLEGTGPGGTLILATHPPRPMSSITSETVSYQSGRDRVSAYMARPREAGKHPAVIVVHEWWGLVPHIKDVANRYASQGYVALAPDLFRGLTTNRKDEAAKLTSSVSTQASSQVLADSLSYLRTKGFVKAERIGVTGFCFGGTHSFHYACVSREIRAAAIYYATRLPSEDLLAQINVPLLIVYGDQDASVKPEQAKQLETVLKRLGKQAELLMYKACPHAFFNDQNPENYRPEAAKDSWEKTQAFFKKHLMA